MTAVVSQIVDRENGLGADVNLVSGTNPAEVTVYVARYNGAWQNLTFTESGSVLDADTIRLTLATGPYVASIVHDGVPNGVYGFRVSDGSLSLHKQCLDAVRAHVIALALPGMTSDATRHVIHKKPVYSLRELGGDASNYSGVHYWPLPERRVAADNVRDNVVYPVQFAWVKGSDSDITIEDAWMKSRQILSQSYYGCPFADVDEINMVEVIPAALYDSDAVRLNADLQSLIFDCHTQQPRIVV